MAEQQSSQTEEQYDTPSDISETDASVEGSTSETLQTSRERSSVNGHPPPSTKLAAHDTSTEINDDKVGIEPQSPDASSSSDWSESIELQNDPVPDGLDFIEPAEPDDGAGLACELHVYESRFDTRGEEVQLRVGVKQEFEPDRDKSHAAALVLTRYYCEFTKTLERTTLQIKSPPLRNALKTVIKSYPGIHFAASGNITLEDNDVWCLFHYRAELKAYSTASENIRLQEHMSLCLQYMERKFEKEIAKFRATVENRQANAGLDFRSLWMVYKPGELMFSKSHGIETVTILEEMFLHYEGQSDEHWSLSVKRLRCIRTQLGYSYGTLTLQKFDGVREFSSLEIFPLCYHPERQRIKKQLTERGKKYLSLRNIHHCQYRGVARLSRDSLPTTQLSELMSTVVRQRIVVDSEEFHNNLANLGAGFSHLREVLGNVDSNIEFADTDFLICDHEVPAYTLTSKKWGLFGVQDVQPVELNESAFENLILAAETKKMLHSLIQSRSLGSLCADDFIVGKGKGLIILVHGPPGVGKTFTAEAMADCARMPLVSVNAGEFIGPPPVVEHRLANILRRSTRWKALLLLDEADVFMQARNLQDLDRNGLVSVLLRTLEYFEGTLFLTTNRVETIDPAFMSRIQLAVSYPSLSREAKSELWETWIERTCQHKRPKWLTSQMLGDISRLDLNGRDIKNAALLAESLAKGEQRAMESNDILQAVAARTQFQEDFTSTITSKTQRGHQAASSRADFASSRLSWLKVLSRYLW